MADKKCVIWHVVRRWPPSGYVEIYSTHVSRRGALRRAESQNRLRASWGTANTDSALPRFEVIADDEIVDLAALIV